MKTAVIMGAGPAGLTAAYELLTKTDIKPIIIEMDAQVGGLSKTINYKGNLIDIGGHRFFSKSEKIITWWLQFLSLHETVSKSIALSYQNQIKELQPAGLSQKKGKMLIRPRKSRIYYNKSFFDYPLSLSAKTLRNFGFRKLTRIGYSYLRAQIFPLKNEKTLEDFFINRFGRELYKTFFKGYTEKIWGVSCDSIPADWGRQRIKDLNIGKAIRQSVSSLFISNKSITQKGVSTSLIEQFLYPENGPGQVWETVAEKIIELGGEIRLNTKIEKIIADGNNNIKSVLCKDLVTHDQLEIQGTYFFSTIPVKHLIEGLENVFIPKEIKNIASNLQYRDFMIVGLLFKKAVDLTGTIGEMSDNWIYLQDEDLNAGRLQIFNNWSPNMVKDNGNIWLGVEFFCNTKDAIWSKSEAEMIALALDELKKTGLVRTEGLLDGTVIRVPKAYPSYIGVFNQFGILQNWIDNFTNLYLIGRNGMHRYNNTDHSMMTAMKAVDNIISDQKSKANIWAVNMEQDFHE